MYKFQTLGVSWPPKGWKQLTDIKYYTGQAIVKNPVSAKVAGLIYKIEPLSLRCENDTSMSAYAIQIEGWEYTIHNESSEYPILSFTLKERGESQLSLGHYISDLQTQSRFLKITERSAHRSLMAALFFIKQIDSGSVPDIDRILKLYRIHPSQKNLYSAQKTRDTSLYRGLSNSNLNESESI